MDPDFKAFKQRYKSYEVGDRPLLFMYAENKYFLEKYRDTLADFVDGLSDQFECYFTTEEHKHQVKQLFNVKDVPQGSIYLVIVDKQDRVKKLNAKNLYGLLDISPEYNNFYFRKFTPDQPIFYGEDVA